MPKDYPDGFEVGMHRQRRVYGEAEEALLARFADDRSRRARGEAPTTLPLMGEPASGALYRAADAYAWYSAAYARAPGATPEVTLRSVELARSYNPADYIERVSPTPLLMQVADHDTTPTDLALRAFRSALEPKSLHIVPDANHFDVYIRDFESVCARALEWFQQHLDPAHANRNH